MDANVTCAPAGAGGGTTAGSATLTIARLLRIASFSTVLPLPDVSGSFEMNLRVF